jgi:hypothetical protein
MAPEGTAVDWSRYRAVLFDLDGVITPTASVHERAWAELFEPWGFTGDDYLTHVDGKPRYDGVRAFLASRGVELPEGVPGEPPGDGTVTGLGNRKDVLFRELLDRDGVEPYPGTMAVIEVLDLHGIPQAVVSSSRNARPVLAAAGLVEGHAVDDRVEALAEAGSGQHGPGVARRRHHRLRDAVAVEHLDHRHGARVRLDAVAVEQLSEQQVLAVSERGHARVAGRVIRDAVGELDPSRRQERPHAVVAGLAVDVGEVVVTREPPRLEQLGPGPLVHRRGRGDDPVEVEQHGAVARPVDGGALRSHARRV